MYQAINFAERLAKFSERWSPRVVGELNDYQLKLVKIMGEFVWHNHAETDEVFIVLAGQMSIEFHDGRVDLAAGEMFIVPRGIEHKPAAEQECHILLIEPQGVVNTGSAGGSRTAANDIWV